MAIIKKHILFAASALLLVACGNDAEVTSSQTSADKTEVPVTVAFVDAAAQTLTRASGHNFTAGDQLIAHISHVEKNGDAYSTVGNDDLGQTRTFTVDTDVKMKQVGETSTYETSNITSDKTIYWDDFCHGDDDIRKDGHGLQVQWGYGCATGSEFISNIETDVLNGTGSGFSPVGYNQKQGYENYDLLWTKTGEVVRYLHGSSADDVERTGLVIPYTHALSKVTIILNAGEGFDDNSGVFDEAYVDLNNLNLTGKFTASTATVENGTCPTDYKTIEMYKASKGDKTATFEAIFVPTKLSEQKEGGDDCFAKVGSVGTGSNHYNAYKIYITKAILEAWGLTGEGNNATTKSGVNYQLTVTLNKAKVDVKAQLTDWETKPTTGDADIVFSTDLTNVDPSGDLTDGTSYDIYRGTSTEELAYATTRKYTAATEEGGTGTWANDPEIYWQDASTNCYFRGLATLDADNKVNSVKASTEDEPSTAAKQGVDLLWATTAKHTGTSTSNTTTTVEEGAAIEPRTSHVPMSFRHAMSRVTFNLVTSEDLSKEDLKIAQIKVPYLYTEGTIDVATGKITGSGTKTEYFKTYSGVSTIVIPQKVKDKKVKIVLGGASNNGTTYIYTLPDDAWEGGYDYTYTIMITKEKIELRALVKEWNVKKGSGNATLDWDL